MNESFVLKATDDGGSQKNRHIRMDFKKQETGDIHPIEREVTNDVRY